MALQPPPMMMHRRLTKKKKKRSSNDNNQKSWANFWVLLASMMAASFPATTTTSAFVVVPVRDMYYSLTSRKHSCFITTTTCQFASRRYGPPLDDNGSIEGFGDNHMDSSSSNRSAARELEQKEEFRKLLDKVRTASRPEHIPSLLTKHTELLLNMQGHAVADIVQTILKESQEQGGDAEVERVAEAIDMIFSFAEDFVNQSKDLDDDNKQLLGRIIRTMTSAHTEGTTEREEKLDDLIANEKNQFTRGFLRHLDGECERIASAPTVTKESLRLQETLLVIKTRILEELGKDLGEGALVLGQLVAYDDRNERMAVLDAGLQVRGVGFAQELRALTEEALEGFESVPNGADPTLVERVREIDENVKLFIDENSTFQ